MKRFCYVIVLMVLSSSAYAGHSFSFGIGRHRVRIEAPRHCHFPSCFSASIPGSYDKTRRGRDRYDDVDAAPATVVPAKPLAPAPQPVSLRPAVPAASKPSIEPVASAPTPTPQVALAASTTREVAAPPPSTIQPSRIQPTTPPMTPQVETPTDAARPAPATAPRISKIAREVDDAPAETPLGDWLTEGNKGSVRIERCGRALCGHVLNPSSNDHGEMVLINMKPKAARWSGNIYSRDSENTYYATIAMKGPNSLRVEACALGRFFCSGNVWSRIGAKPEKLVTSHQSSPEPRS
jgi:uncharacterized protein (DUF2147 family)